jgi:hypothetical protein
MAERSAGLPVRTDQTGAAVVDAVGGEGEVAEAAFGEVELFGGHAFGVAEVCEVFLPVEALGLE